MIVPPLAHRAKTAATGESGALMPSRHNFGIERAPSGSHKPASHEIKAARHPKIYLRNGQPFSARAVPMEVRSNSNFRLLHDLFAFIEGHYEKAVDRPGVGIQPPVFGTEHLLNLLKG